MRKRFRFGLLGSVAAALLAALLLPSMARAPRAEAHPLGNFTVNRYSRIELFSDVIRIHYVLDMAEIPTFQEKDAIDADEDGGISEAERSAYAPRKAAEITRRLSLVVNGSVVDLAVLLHQLGFPPGQGGLGTLRLALVLEAPLAGRAAPGSRLSVQYRDGNYSDRIGWKEIVVRPADGVPLLDSTVPSGDITDELRSYPQDFLSSPLDVREAAFTFVPGTGAAAPAVPGAAVEAVESAPERAGAGFASLIAARELSLPVLLLSLLAALGFGALHALEPGHGKTFVAAYFVGVRGTARQAMLLGLIIAATHTVGVLAIGLVTLYGSRLILPERLYPWLSLASALLLVGLGLRLLASRLAGLRPRSRDHEADGTHEHSHRHPANEDGSPPWRTLVWLGLADGLTPSPSALIVLLAAVSLDRIGLGLLLIAAFSVGLAGVLAMVSLALVYARRLLEWLSGPGGLLHSLSRGGLAAVISPEGRVLRLVPLGGALALMALGLALAARAMSQPAFPV